MRSPCSRSAVPYPGRRAPSSTRSSAVRCEGPHARGPAQPCRGHPGTDTPTWAAACHGPGRPGPLPPSVWVTSRLPQPIRLPEPAGDHAAGGHCGQPRVRSPLQEHL